jgi:hypothetical protein
MLRVAEEGDEESARPRHEFASSITMAGLGLDDAPARRAALQRQQTAVQFLQARAVPDTDDRRLG